MEFYESGATNELPSARSYFVVPLCRCGFVFGFIYIYHDGTTKMLENEAFNASIEPSRFDSLIGT